MARLKIIGSEPRLRHVLAPWPYYQATGGHTTIEFKGTHTEVVRDIYASLVTEYSFTPINTTMPDAPVKAPTRLPAEVDEELEVTFIPQYAGG